MELLLLYLGVYVFISCTFGMISKTITSRRGMEGGFWWGFFLGVIGIIVVAVRPKE